MNAPQGDRSIASIVNETPNTNPSRTPLDANWLLAAKRAVATVPLGAKGDSLFFEKVAVEAAGPSPYNGTSALMSSCVADGILSRTGQLIHRKYRNTHGKAVSNRVPEFIRGEVEATVAPPAPVETQAQQIDTARFDKVMEDIRTIKEQLRVLTEAFARHFT